MPGDFTLSVQYNLFRHMVRDDDGLQEKVITFH